MVLNRIDLALKVAFPRNQRACNAILIWDLIFVVVNVLDDIWVEDTSTQFLVEVEDIFSWCIELVVVLELAEALRLNMIDKKRRSLIFTDVCNIDSVQQSTECRSNNLLHFSSL